MNTLPLWLQITGILVGTVAGIAGIVLGILNLFLRRQDTKPRLSVEAKVESHRRQWLELVVRNKGRVAVTVSDLSARMTHPTEDIHPSTVRPHYRSFTPPYRLESGDRQEVSIQLPLISSGPSGPKARPIEDQHTVIVTVEDGLGNHYESKPVRTDLWLR
jgi:hypothetical protein